MASSPLVVQCATEEIAALIQRLRIAASVIFAVLTVALCVLWVRSHSYRYSLEKKTNSRVLSIASERGILTYWHQHPKPFKEIGILLDELSQGRAFDSSPVYAESDLGVKGSVLGFGLRRRGSSTQASIPIWSVVLTCAAISFALQAFPFSRRFSLRSLLIATTLVAVVLGLICYTVR